MAWREICTSLLKMEAYPSTGERVAGCLCNYWDVTGVINGLRTLVTVIPKSSLNFWYHVGENWRLHFQTVVWLSIVTRLKKSKDEKDISEKKIIGAIKYVGWRRFIYMKMTLTSWSNDISNYDLLLILYPLEKLASPLSRFVNLGSQSWPSKKNYAVTIVLFLYLIVPDQVTLPYSTLCMKLSGLLLLVCMSSDSV